MAIVSVVVDNNPIWWSQAHQALLQRRSLDVILRGWTAASLGTKLAAILAPIPSTSPGKVYSITMNRLVALNTLVGLPTHAMMAMNLVHPALASGYKVGVKWEKNGASSNDDELRYLYRL